MKSLKLFFIFVTALSIQSLSSCDNFGDNKINDIVNKYENITSLKINESFDVDNINYGNKTIYLTKSEVLKGYSTGITKSNKFNYNDLKVEEFVYDNNVFINANDNNTQHKFEQNNTIIEYLGIGNILNNVKKEKNGNKKISGSIDAKLGGGVVRSFFTNIGELKDSYENYFFNSKINYDVYLNYDKKEIDSIVLDITDSAKLKKQDIESVSLTYMFSFEDNIEQTINNHPFPNNGGNSSSNEQEIKEKGIEYIKDCYSDIKYVSDDLFLYTNSIISPRLSFKYESSNTNVIGNDGKYYSVNIDTEITLTVHLFYSSVEYSKLDFTFLAVPKTSGTGDLGSQTNMLYKGRKEIDNVNIYFIEMHKQYGVSVYVQAGDFDMLLDAGAPEDGGYVNDFLRRHISDGRLELVVASHPHSDHMGGMNTALSTIKNITYAVDYGCIRDYSAVSSTRARFKQADKYSPVIDCVNNRNGARKVLYITNDMYVTFLNTGYYEEEDKDISSYDGHGTNNTSVALLLTYKNQNFFFAGDLENEAQSSLLSRENIFKVDVLTSSHHGSSNANGTPLLSKMKPTVSVISTALVNRGSKTSQALDQTHPIGSALKNLLSYSNKVYCNFTTGTLQVTLNGGIDVKGLGVTSPYYLDGVAVTGEENLEFKYTKYAKRYRSKYI